jgi:hypothetical protein
MAARLRIDDGAGELEGRSFAPRLIYLVAVVMLLGVCRNARRLLVR